MSHRRNGNAVWKLRKGGGLFGGGVDSLVVEATQALRKGEAVSMDFNPGKLDGAVLLDHGVIDDATSRVGAAAAGWGGCGLRLGGQGAGGGGAA